MTQVLDAPVWHLLQVSDVLDVELGTALAESVPVIGWRPLRTLRALRTPAGSEDEQIVDGSTLRVRQLPLIPGYSRFPVSLLMSAGPSIMERLLRQTADASFSPLICTVPYFASVAEQWPGPVVYWLTDLIAAYGGANRVQVEELDRRMCRAATLVYPNSERLKQYLIDRADCPPDRIQIVPNATRTTNILRSPPSRRADDHPALSGIPRPIAGIIGNLAGNTDWLFLEELLKLEPAFSWVMIGPSSMRIEDPQQSAARERVMQHPATHFLGQQPYGELASFARAFDVAVLPYKRREPTYSGSSTRFYEHLAACRPMIATSGLDELTRKPPLLRITDTPDIAAEVLRQLRVQNFDDGLLDLRWHTSKANTWQARARTMQIGLAAQLQKRPASTISETLALPQRRFR